MAALVALAETISRTHDLRTILDDALGKVLELVALECGEIFILDPETGRLLLRACAGRLRAIIEDDGVGFDVAATLADAPEERKLGLVGMQERAGLLGGSCTFESRPGGGCSVFVEVPIPLEGDTYEREDTAIAGR